MVNTYVLTIRLLKAKAKLCQKENAASQQRQQQHHQQSNRSKPCVQCKVLGMYQDYSFLKKEIFI